MDRQVAVPRISKSQRENHSEIERKRRQRMKRDTEFLRRQIPSSHCKDKLSIFQLGAERLIQYTDKLGKRDYIINDVEYSRLILDNFDGFDVHIRCPDGEVTYIHKNAENILDISVDDLIGCRINDLAEPSSSTAEIIDAAFRGSELQWEVFKGVISRNFILALRCGHRVPLHHCVYGSDGKVYRFIEFCGDLTHQTDPTDDAKSTIVFRGLCRPLDPACGAIVKPAEDRNSSVGFICRDLAPQFTLRLSNIDHRILEVVGDFKSLLGCSSASLLQTEFRDLVAPYEQLEVDQMLVEAAHCTGTVQRRLHLVHTQLCHVMEFDAHLNAVRVAGQLHCFVCRLNPCRPLLVGPQNGETVVEDQSLPDFTSRTGFLNNPRHSCNSYLLSSNSENSDSRPVCSYNSNFVQPVIPVNDPGDNTSSLCFPDAVSYPTSGKSVFEPTALNAHAPSTNGCEQVETQVRRFGNAGTPCFGGPFNDEHSMHPARFMDMLQDDTNNT